MIDINSFCKENNIILESALFDKHKSILSVNFLHSEFDLISDKQKKEILEKLCDQFNISEKEIIIKYKKIYFDNEILYNTLMREIEKNFPYISLDKSNVILIDKNRNNSIVKLKFSSIFKNAVQSESFSKTIETVLTDEFYQQFNINYEFYDEQVIDSVDEPIYIVNGSGVKNTFNITTTEKYINELVEGPFQIIATILEPNSDLIKICGRIKNLTKHETKEKVKEDGKIVPPKAYYKFVVYDYSSEISVIVFSTKSNATKFDKLENGLDVAIEGIVDKDKFSNGLIMSPKNISLCILQPAFFELEYSVPIRDEYKYIKPEAYLPTTQVNIFDVKKEITSKYLLDNEFVVFDLETTGVDYLNCDIIEIGAVKLKNGKIIESFSTLVNPKTHIPEDASAVNNIFDEDVKDANTIDQVLPDFLLFCKNCIMVSYVIDFDYNFILQSAKKYHYSVKNKTDDAFVLAKKYIKGLKNYKLKTVVKEEGIELTNAHRALNDTIATAELFIKICNDNNL